MLLWFEILVSMVVLEEQTYILTIRLICLSDCVDDFFVLDRLLRIHALSQ